MNACARTNTLVLLVLGAMAVSAARGRAQDARGGDATINGAVFPPLVADPKQPHFFSVWLWVDSPLLRSTVASVGLGEDIGLFRARNGRWQVSLAPGVFSQFDLGTPSNDLINTDFVVGVPIAHRWRRAAVRFRFYHQSSHLGDEFILNTNPERVNLSFEAVDLLVSGELGPVRVYGGGEYIVRHEPSELKPGLLHGGLEYRGRGNPRLVAGLDLKPTQERNWDVGFSGRVGIQLRPAGVGAFPSMSVLLQGYTGPAPYGQFYQSAVRSVGVGVHFAL
ncbi:MAG TPA: DUF1207 domain-containing protein [Gemmatimonadales bacterium]|nr:DUF1207 domain-containing protein [Gemmatimonadales bacterium]